MIEGEVYLRVIGIASPKVFDVLYKTLDRKINLKRDIVLFIDFSDFDVPLECGFNSIQVIDGNVVYEGKFILRKVTQQFDKLLKVIPSGWKTIGQFEFMDSDVPTVLRALPIIDNWYGARSQLIFK